MTPEQAATLRHFKWSEFHHPELMDYAFCTFVDDVRHEFGFPVVLTSDARTANENAAASGSRPTSRHLAGQAVDFKFPPTANHLWLLVAAVMRCMRAPPVELELVNSAQDQHVHLAWLEPGRASKLLVKAD